MPLLKDKVAFITGAAAGIGEATASVLAEEGACVFILDINHAGGRSVAAAIETRGGFALSFESDVRRPETIRPAVEEAIERFGRIDILINNAGIYPRRPFLEISEEQWDEVQEVNLKGVFHCTQLVLPQMIQQRSGKIVNVSSVTFHAGMKNLGHYITSKGGIIGLTRALAREFAEYNIHVNCITPGAIETEREKAVATPTQIQAILEAQCLKRRIVPLDVARVCLFLASELSDGMTGQTVNVDGGWILY